MKKKAKEQKPPGAVLDFKVKVADLAAAFGVTTHQVHLLAKEGTLIRAGRGEYPVLENVRKYCERLRKASYPKMGPAGDADYEKSRARLTAAKADSEEIKLAQLQGKVVEVEAVERVWNGMVSIAKTRILGVPSKIAPRLKGKKDPAEIQSIIENALHETLQSLSEYENEKFIEQVEVAKNSEGDGDGMDATAANEPI